MKVLNYCFPLKVVRKKGETDPFYEPHLELCAYIKKETNEMYIREVRLKHIEIKETDVLKDAGAQRVHGPSEKRRLCEVAFIHQPLKVKFTKSWSNPEDYEVTQEKHNG